MNKPDARSRRSCLPVFLMAALLALAESEPRTTAAQDRDRGTPDQQPRVKGLAFSPDGKLLAAVFGEPSERGRLVVWETTTRKVKFVHEEPVGIGAVAFAADGRQVAIGIFGETARLIDADTGKVVRTFKGHENYVRSVGFTPDGKTLVTGSYDRTVRLWDVETGRLQSTLQGHGGEIYSIDVSPDGLLIASGSRDKTARLWDVQTGKPKHIFEASDLIVRHVAFSPDGRWLLTGRYDGRVRIWNARTYDLRARIRTGGGIACVRLSSDNRTLAVCSHRPEISVYEVDLAGPDAADQERIAALITKWRDDSYAVREAASRELVKIGLVAEPALREAMKAKSAEVRIRARRARSRILSADPKTVLRGHSGEVGFLCFSPDGKLLATGDRNGDVKLWETARFEEIGTLR